MDAPRKRRRAPAHVGKETNESTPTRGAKPASGKSGDAVGPFQVETLDAALHELECRLAIVRDRVRGVALGHHVGLYLYGRRGTAKTHTVRMTLDTLGLPYYYHNGHLTPLGLFELLAEQHDRLILLDDVAPLFEQRVAIQILLAALGNQPNSAGGRIVKYRRQGRVEVVRFSGGIISISNLELGSAPLLQAFKSRVHYLKYDVTEEQLAALMLEISRQGWPAARPRLSPAACREVTEYLMAESARLSCHLDLRQLVDKAFPDYLQHREGNTEAHWHDLVTASLEGQLVELRHAPRAQHSSRQERKEYEQQVVRQLLQEHATPQLRLAAWQQRTGKSARAFYRRLGEIRANIE